MILLFSGEDPTGHRFEEYLNPLEEITKKGISLDRKKMWSRIALGHWGGETLNEVSGVCVNGEESAKEKEKSQEGEAGACSILEAKQRVFGLHCWYKHFSVLPVVFRKSPGYGICYLQRQTHTTLSQSGTSLE